MLVRTADTEEIISFDEKEAADEIPTDPRHVSIHKRPLLNLMTMSSHFSQRYLYTGSLSSYLERHKAIR